MTRSAYGQYGLFDHANKLSVLDSRGSFRFADEFNVAIGRQYGSARSMGGVGGDMGSGSGELSSGSSGAMEELWDGTGDSRGTVSSASRSTALVSDIASGLISDPGERSVSDIDSQHVVESAGSEDDTSDGNGLLYNKTDRRSDQFDQAQLDSLWTEPKPCLLEGCRSKHLFPTPQSFSSHLKNVHEKAVFCPEPYCTFGKPFANNTDLKRHVNTIHKEKKPFKCERQHCHRKVKAWPRKDKLRLHNQKHHSNFRCFFCSEDPRHQRWFDTASELFAHNISDHSLR